MDSVYFLIGLYMTLFAYHFLVFLGRRKDKSNLFFALYCLSYSFFLYWNSVYWYSQGFNFKLFHLLYAVNSVIFAAVYCRFPYTVFIFNDTEGRSKVLIITMGLLNLVCIVLFAFTGEIIWIRVVHVILLISTVILLVLLQFSLFRKKHQFPRDKMIILIGFLLLSLFIVAHTLLMAVFLETPSRFVTRILFTLLAFSFSYSLTSRFNQEHKDLLLLKNSLEDKVQARTRDLEKAKTQKENFFINIAHELKTPLTIVSNSFTEFYENYEPKKDLQQINKGLEKLKKDINNFLDLRKLEAGQLYFNHEQIIDIVKMTEEAAALFQPRIASRELRLKLQMDKGPICIMMDPCAFDRILNNFIENAIKYNRPQGVIEIFLRRKTGSIVFTIKDTGDGIDEKALPHIFSPYYQISEKKRNIQGMGMGLAIVKEICDDVGVTIDVKSQTGFGSEFTIIFSEYLLKQGERPVSLDRNEPPLIDATDSLECEIKEIAYSETKSNLLIVEDNGDLLAFLVNKLQQKYNVFYACNGRQALDLIATMPEPQMIISDIMMDEMDGLDFRASLVNQGKYNSIPFIFLTAYRSRYLKLKSLADGAIDYIVKPFEIEELIYKIEAIMKIKKALSIEKLDEIREFLNKYFHNVKPEFQGSGIAKQNVPLKNLYTRYNISDQEVRVISLLKQGLMYKEIASAMTISINSVRTYVKRIYKKLNIHSTSELFEILPDQ